VLTLKSGLMALGGLVAGVSVAFGGLGDKLFKEKLNPKNMLVGLGEMADGFDSIGTSAKNIEPELAKATKTAGKLGDNLFGQNAPVAEALQIQASVGNNDVMNKSMETAAGLSEATFNRTAAPTAANTNIASNSSNNTYVSSGPESAEINVSIGGEHLERYVKKFSDKRTTKAIAGRS